MNVKAAAWAIAVLCVTVAVPGATPAQTAGIRIGVLTPGPLDAITDVRGVLVGQVTLIEGSGALKPGVGPVRTGVTVVVPNADPWNERVAAGTFDLNGNGEMTGTHWVNESGFLEVPIALTNTLNVGKVDDGVIDWMFKRYPNILEDDVPLPVVAECDDQGMNDIQGRHVSQADVVKALDGAAPGRFARGAVGAGTGMHAFGFKGGIGTASRIVARDLGGYTVGVLTNVNDGRRSELRIDGVPIGRDLQHELLPVYPRGAAVAARGRPAGGSIIVVVATDAPLDNRQLNALAKRAALGLARTGWNSHISSGDLFMAFSTTRVYPRDPKKSAATALVNDEDTLDALYAATAEATEGAVADALFNAVTMTGANGVTLYALPVDRVRTLLQSAGAVPAR
jgi:D-aminopeptidase